jgi:glycosyltransferase involved in cell wall biosynthesis
MTSLTTAIVLSWNNLSVSKDTIRRLKRECPIIVVDNGSTDGSQLYFADRLKKDEYIQMGYNAGNCLARNAAIKKVKTKYFFLIDGDILYVPNSIKILEEILEKYPKCGCVGVNNNNSIKKYGFNGTPNLMEAAIKAERNPIFKGFPMAWTQYGLFRNTGQIFPDFDPFDTAGIGYEDDWFYHEMKEKELESYYITEPLYFHDAHAGKRELTKANQDFRESERKEAFEKKYGKAWMDKQLNIELV